MVPSDNQSQHRRDLGSGVISVCWCEVHPSDYSSRAYLLVKTAELAELIRYRHTFQVLVVPYRLKIPTYQEQIDFVVVLRLETSDMLVNRVQLPMATSFNCDLVIVRYDGDAAEL